MKKGESVKIKRRRKFPVFLVIILLLLIAIIVIVLKIKKRQSEKIPFEELQPTAIATAKEYVEEKYGDAVTYSGIHEGRTSIILGERNWKVTFTDKNDQSYDVMVRHDSDNNCMYIEWDHYYGYYIEERMMEWMESQLGETNLNEYILVYAQASFNTEWPTDWSAEQILQELKNNGERGYKGIIMFDILIPEREREIYDSGELLNELNELFKDLEGIKIDLIIYPDDIFDQYLEAPDNNRFKYIEWIDLWESKQEKSDL